MKVNNRRKRKITDFICRGLIYLSTGLTVAILLVILGFVLYKGLPGINIRFLTRQWDDKTTIVRVITNANDNSNSSLNENSSNSSDENYVSSLGIIIGMENKEIAITKIDRISPVKKAANLKNKEYALKTHDVIREVDDVKLEDMTLNEAAKVLNNITDNSKIKVTRPGGGILPMLISTLYIILISLCIAAPIGICSAIYLNEYAKPGKVLRLIRFAIQNLAGIPSIIYGLFGMLVFVRLFKMEYSILAGSLTLSILLLPTIIATTEEALKEIPKAYRESSYGLGATKLQTISKIILPGALPGILVAVILSIGRIVGESAALIWTAGTVAQIPKALVGSKAGAATLTTKLYWVIKETGNLETACSIAIVLIGLIIILNIISKLITNRFLKKRGTN